MYEKCDIRIEISDYLIYYITEGGFIMKEQKSKATEVKERVAYSIAKHYANVSCPLFTYQTKMPDSVKKMRKF